MEEFKLPPSDERFSSLTAREALEQLQLAQAVKDWKKGRRSTDEKSWQADEKSALIADTPHWTGDPELDAIEAQETNPAKGGNLIKEYEEWQREKRRRAGSRKSK